MPHARMLLVEDDGAEDGYSTDATEEWPTAGPSARHAEAAARLEAVAQAAIAAAELAEEELQKVKAATASASGAVKAAEPFTSATVVVLWDIERLGKEEVASLAGIVAVVALSTLSSAKPKPSRIRVDVRVISQTIL